MINYHIGENVYQLQLPSVFYIPFYKKSNFLTVLTAENAYYTSWMADLNCSCNLSPKLLQEINDCVCISQVKCNKSTQTKIVKVANPQNVLDRSPSMILIHDDEFQCLELA